MIGGARKGYCSKERRASVNVPMITITIEMTMATIGRRMKKLDTGLPSGLPLAGGRGRRRLLARSGRRRARRRVAARPQRGLHLHAGPYLLHALDDDALSWLEPLGHDVEVADPLVEGHGPESHLVLGVHDKDDLVALLLLHGQRGHENGVAPLVHSAAHAGELAGPQDHRRIRELGLDGDRARLLVEGPAQEDEAPL